MTRLVDAGQLRVVLDHLSPLEQAALSLGGHGHMRGKVDLSIA